MSFRQALSRVLDREQRGGQGVAANGGGDANE
jgi:hypothetical protein